MLMSTQILLSILIALIGVLIILCNKYDYKIIKISGTIVFIAGVLYFCGLIVTRFFGDVETVTDSYAIYEIDERYIIYTGEQSTTPNVYIESDETEGAYTRKSASDAEIMIGDYNPHIDHIKTIRTFLVYKTTSNDYIIYLPENTTE